VRALGGRVANVDVTILCEAPKIGPHRAEMCRSIADMLQIDPSRVGVKATTMEGLGFVGRGEGIAAIASALILLPA
jgi:2-C-methyl-D-erythritol 4-phosphate cytidylyltransferase/2-C-methyl-D-erythritol 2,4-cyclodiphosphate synthase